MSVAEVMLHYATGSCILKGFQQRK